MSRSQFAAAAERICCALQVERLKNFASFRMLKTFLLIALPLLTVARRDKTTDEEYEEVRRLANNQRLSMSRTPIFS